jgi:hypothetical protein
MCLLLLTFACSTSLPSHTRLHVRSYRTVCLFVAIRYGTEPWTFYFVNGTLNLGLAFALGLLGPVVALIAPVRSGALTAALYLSPLIVWIAIFFPQAHKEERFLFPVCVDLFFLPAGIGVHAPRGCFS